MIDALEDKGRKLWKFKKKKEKEEKKRRMVKPTGKVISNTILVALKK